MWFCFLFCIFL